MARAPASIVPPIGRVPLMARHRVPEIMDDPQLDAPRHRAALRGLEHINRVSAAARVLRAPLARLARARPRETLRILDVATGAGDTPIRLARWSQRSGFSFAITGCDRSPFAVDHARRRAAEAHAPVTFTQRDVEADGLPDGYDVLICSLFMHHLSEEGALRLLRRMSRAARHLVLANDLARGPTGYLAAVVGTKLLSRSEVVHADGPASVRAAFTSAEARALADAAGLSGAVVKRCWPFRWLLVWSRV